MKIGGVLFHKSYHHHQLHPHQKRFSSMVKLQNDDLSWNLLFTRKRERWISYMNLSRVKGVDLCGSELKEKMESYLFQPPCFVKQYQMFDFTWNNELFLSLSKKDNIKRGKMYQFTLRESSWYDEEVNVMLTTAILHQKLIMLQLI